MRNFIVNRSDGGISVLRIKGNADVQEEIAKLAVSGGWQKKGWTVIGSSEVDDATIPAPKSTARLFRNSWIEHNGASVVHDMIKAREIHMARIREERDKELKRLDIEYIRADEQNNVAEKTRLASEKQTLRDLPQTFDLSSALDVDQLKALWPAGLPMHRDYQ